MSIIPDIESPQLTSELLLEFIIDEVEVKSKLQSLYTDRSSGRYKCTITASQYLINVYSVA